MDSFRKNQNRFYLNLTYQGHRCWFGCDGSMAPHPRWLYIEVPSTRLQWQYIESRGGAVDVPGDTLRSFPSTRRHSSY